MHLRPPYRPAGDRVYQAIKARLIAYEFPQGRRILLEPIAEALGVSTTPVREAMNRLAERDLVIKAENKGFYAMTLMEERVRGHYEITRQLLILGLRELPPSAEHDMPNCAALGEIVSKLNRRPISDYVTLARHTSAIFRAIAALSGNSAVELAVELANDHLHFIRTLECQYLRDVQDELKQLCELCLAGERMKLTAAIDTYHNKRLAMLPKLMAEQAP